jgi:hypothetical protein
MPVFLCLFFSFFLGLPAFASGPESPAWRALLHFESGQSSVRADSDFFLSPVGFRDPAAEWEATARLLETSEGACRFPARARIFGKTPGREGDLCARYHRWKEAVSATGIELVFAAAFLNSPSSMYGHTLLKFPRGGRTEKDELLDYTLNYGADTGSAAGFSYVWQGLTGGFDGNYATAPFYLKVKEYNFVENRDFWVYPLRVTDEELALLVDHAWELRDIDFPYFFLKKNCAYYLLEFLEVARPGAGLVDAFPLWAVPMDTIRRLEKHGWLGEGRLRPSRQKLLAARKESFSGAEISRVSALLEGGAGAVGAGGGSEGRAGEAASVVDAAYDLWRYRSEGKKLGAEDNATEARLLALRAAAGKSPPPVIAEVSPHLGHPTNRLSLGAGRDRARTFAELSYRGTLHDILSHPLGFEPSSELSMGDIRLRWQDKIFLERLDVLRLRSLAPTERWFPRHAWSFRAGFQRVKEMNCLAWRCSSALLQGGWGLSVSLGPVLFFGLGEIDAEWAGVFKPDYRFSAGPTAGIFSPLWPGGRILLEGETRFRLLGERRQRRSARLGLNQDLSRRWELRFEGAVDRGAREGLLRVNHYF